MRYRCIPCNHEFEANDGIKARCPRCMGIHDLEQLTGEHGKQVNRRPWLVPLVVLILAAGVFAAYFFVGTDEGADDAAPLAGDDLAEILTALGVPGEELAIPFAMTPEIATFAQRFAADLEGIAAIQALLDAIGAARKEGKWAPHSQRESRSDGPLTAAELLAEFDKARDEPWKATSYELACLLLALARSVEVDAYLAQIHTFTGEQRPADPGGRLGRYGVVVGQGSDQDPPPLFDPFAHRSGESAKGDFDVLTDQQAVAPYYAHRSLASLARFDTSKAFKLNDLATKIDPNNALYRIGRAYIFIFSEAPTEALAEIEKAVKRRDDAVNRLILADLLIKTTPVFNNPGNLTRAENEINIAIGKMPEYAEAHALLAMVHVARRDFTAAETELATGQRLDPLSPEVAMSWANFYLQQNMAEEAIDKAEQASRLSNQSLDSLLALAGVYRVTARFEEMRATLDKLYAKIESPALAKFIREAFKYDPDAETDEGDDAGPLEMAAGSQPDGGLFGLELQLDADKGPLSGPRLGDGLGDGLGGGLGRGLGGGLGRGLGGGSKGGLGGGLGGSASGLGGGLQTDDLQLKMKPPSK